MLRRNMASVVVTSSQVIEDKEFNGGAPLLTEDWAPFIVKNFENLGKNFFHPWNGTPGVILTGELSADGAQIESLNIVAVGKIFTTKPADFAANRFWSLTNKNVAVRINTIDLKKFKFDARMWSDFLDHSEISYKMLDEHENTYPLGDLVMQQWDGFCLRLIAAPETTYSVKLYVYLYPHNKERLLSLYSCAGRIEFPGVLLTSGSAELGPQQAGFVLEKNVGCPVIPAIKTPAKLERAPTAGEISWKVAALFRSVSLPETCASVEALKDRMAAVEAEGESQLKGAPTPRIWPESVKPVENPGKFIVTIY